MSRVLGVSTWLYGAYRSGVEHRKSRDHALLQGGGGGFMSQPDYEHGIPNVTGLSILGTVTVDWAGGLGKDCACRRNDIPTAAHAQLTPRLTTESHRNTQSDWRLVIPYP